MKKQMMRHLSPPNEATARCWYLGVQAIAECNFRITAALMIAAMLLGLGGGALLREDIEGIHGLMALLFLPTGAAALHNAITLLRFAFMPPGKVIACATADGLYLPIHPAPWVRVFAPAVRPDYFIAWADISDVRAVETERLSEAGTIHISSLYVYRHDGGKALYFNADAMGGLGVAREIAEVALAARHGRLPVPQVQTTRLQIRPLGWLVMLASIVLAGLLLAEGLSVMSTASAAAQPQRNPLGLGYDYLMPGFILLLCAYLWPKGQAVMREYRKTP